MNVENILKTSLPFFNEDILEYLITIINELSLNERQNSNILKDILGPFIIETEYKQNNDEIDNLCRSIAVNFGGSGYKINKHNNNNNNNLEIPELLNAPIKIKEIAGLDQIKQSYGGVVMIDIENSNEIITNEGLDIKDIPNNQRNKRKMKRENEQLARKLRIESAIAAEQRQQMAAARMAAIKASRNSSRGKAMTGLHIENFNLPHPSGTGDLFNDVTLNLNYGGRYGLIGRNGAGKTTLMKTLASYGLPGLEHLKILLVDQHVEGDEETPIQWVLRADVERTSLIAEEARLTSLIIQSTTGEIDNENNPLPEDLVGVNLEIALQEVYERMDTIGVNTAEARAIKILTGLGFTTEMMSSPTQSLSGGWAMRAALAAALFVKPDLLLLDEPTNHLDLHALVWLETYLKNGFEGIAMIVSHDEFFLDEVCTDIIEMKSTLSGAKKGTLTHFSGDYRTYESTLEDRKRALTRAKYTQDIQKEKLKEFISREGRKYDGTAHQSQRKMKMKKLENMEEIELIEEDNEGVLTFPVPNGVFDRDEVLIGVDSASFGWSADNPLFVNVDFVVMPQSRIGIIGRNGCGKTCLLNVLTGELDLLSGTVRRHQGSRITMLQQHHYKGEQLDPDLNALEHIRNLPQNQSTAVGLYDLGTRQEETAQRSYLANFGIQGSRVLIPVKYLSGGQRMKVALAVALYNKPDILILDEPTNHLDSDTVRALGDALQTYKGAIIVVSHDEGFINRLLTGTSSGVKKDNVRPNEEIDGQLWVLSNKKLQRYEGSFRDYKNKILKKIQPDDFKW